MTITTPHIHELSEARAIVRDLSRVEPKNAGDARFIQTWAEYLDHAGDRAAIGRFRLHNLRVVAASYGLCDPVQAAQAGGQALSYGLTTGGKAGAIIFAQPSSRK